MQRFEFYKESYFKEFEIKEKLEKSSSTSITIQVIIGGIISYFLSGVQNSNHNICYYLFVILFSLGIISFLSSIYLNLRSIFNYLYMYLPTSSQLENYYNELTEYYSDKEDKTKLANIDFEEYLLSQYIQNQHLNFENNSKKSRFIHLTNKYLIITISFLFLSAVPYYIENFKDNNPQKVEITNFNDLNFIGDSTMSKIPSQKKITVTTKEKPTPPPSIGRKDGTIRNPTLPPKKK